jgi:hypothetical protein
MFYWYLTFSLTLKVASGLKVSVVREHRRTSEQKRDEII